MSRVMSFAGTSVSIFSTSSCRRGRGWRLLLNLALGPLCESPSGASETPQKRGAAGRVCENERERDGRLVRARGKVARRGRRGRAAANAPPRRWCKRCATAASPEKPTEAGSARWRTHEPADSASGRATGPHQQHRRVQAPRTFFLALPPRAPFAERQPSCRPS